MSTFDFLKCYTLETKYNLIKFQHKLVDNHYRNEHNKGSNLL